MTMTKDLQLPIIYAYPCQWDQNPGRHRYLMEALSAHTPVVFLNSPQLSGRLLEVKRPRMEQKNESLFVIHDAFGFRFTRTGKKLGRAAAAVDSFWMHKILRQIGIESYIYWLAAPGPQYLWGMRRSHFVYDCIDPHLGGPGKALFDRNEFFLAQKAKVVFCTAETLLERLQPVNQHSYLLPNACSLPEYLPQANRELSLPESLQNRPRPIVGYMGTFDSRLDTETLFRAAEALPEFTFALVGRVNEDQKARVKPLQRLPNVVMPGAVSVEQGRAYTTAFDVGLIPFLPGPICDAINPVKMYMYLAAGKPVVTTWLREPARQKALVHVTQTEADFIRAIRQAVTENDEAHIAVRLAFARCNTWQDRARTAVGVLGAAFAPEPAASQRKAIA